MTCRASIFEKFNETSLSLEPYHSISLSVQLDSVILASLDILSLSLEESSEVPSPFSQLPHEIKSLILKEFGFVEEEEYSLFSAGSSSRYNRGLNSFRSLEACSKVDRQLKEIADEYLWCNIDFNREDNLVMQDFIATILPKQQDNIKDLCLKTAPEYNEGIRGPFTDEVGLDTVLTYSGRKIGRRIRSEWGEEVRGRGLVWLLTHCPNLTHIDIDLIKTKSPNYYPFLYTQQQIIASLESLGSQLISLHLTSPHPYNLDATFLTSFLRTFTNLVTLKISRADFSTDVGFFETLSSLSKLRHLNLEDLYDYESFDTLQPWSNELESLSIGSGFNSDAIYSAGLLISNSSSTLKTLQIFNTGYDDRSPDPISLPVLEYISFLGPAEYLTTFNNSPKLKELHCTFLTGLEPEVIIPFLRLHPLLTKVYLEGAKGHDVFEPEFKALMEVYFLSRRGFGIESLVQFKVNRDEFERPASNETFAF